MEDDFARLVTGIPHSRGDFGDIANHLSITLKSLVTESLLLPTGSPTRVSLFGPFLGRSLLELAFTSLVGRIDPFRLLVIRKTQMASFAATSPPIGERFQAAIQWTGDIRPAKDSEGPDTWTHTRTLDKFSRSLFGRHYDELFLKQAFTDVLDRLQSNHQGPWFDEIRRYTPDQFIPWLRARTDQTYSSLSKGIHQEFVIPPAAVYSTSVVFDLVKDAFRYICHMALCTHAIPSCQCSLPINDALDLYERMQAIETILCLPTP